MVQPRLVDELVEEKLEMTYAERNDLSFRDATIRDVLSTKKNKRIDYISPDETVLKAIGAMSSNKIGALLVKDKGDGVVGIFTERDYLNKVVLKGRASPTTKVQDVMTPSPICVTDNTGVLKCMHLMTNRRFRHLPVLNADNEIVGLVSIGDLVKAVIDQYSETVSFLRAYIERTY